MQGRFVESPDGFDIHFLEWKPKQTGNKLPIVCIHGNLTNARMYQWIGENLSSEEMEHPRHVIAIDIRGRGDSGMPEQGFTLHHMAADIETVMCQLGLGKAHFIAYSRGVAYALQYALRNPKSVQSMVIGDHPAYNTRFHEKWAEKMINSYKRYASWNTLFEEIALTEAITREAFETKKEQYYVETPEGIRKRYLKDFPARLARESEDCDLASALGYISGSMLILKGKEEGSLLNEEQIKVFQKYHPQIVYVQGAGHDVFEPRKQAAEAIMHFFNRMD